MSLRSCAGRDAQNSPGYGRHSCAGITCSMSHKAEHVHRGLALSSEREGFVRFFFSLCSLHFSSHLLLVSSFTSLHTPDPRSPPRALAELRGAAASSRVHPGGRPSEGCRWCSSEEAPRPCLWAISILLLIWRCSLLRGALSDSFRRGGGRCCSTGSRPQPPADRESKRLPRAGKPVQGAPQDTVWPLTPHL